MPSFDFIFISIFEDKMRIENIERKREEKIIQKLLESSFICSSISSN